MVAAKGMSNKVSACLVSSAKPLLTYFSATSPLVKSTAHRLERSPKAACSWPKQDASIPYKDIAKD